MCSPISGTMKIVFSFLRTITRRSNKIKMNCQGILNEFVVVFIYGFQTTADVINNTTGGKPARSSRHPGADAAEVQSLTGCRLGTAWRDSGVKPTLSSAPPLTRSARSSAPAKSKSPSSVPFGATLGVPKSQSSGRSAEVEAGEQLVDQWDVVQLAAELGLTPQVLWRSPRCRSSSAAVALEGV